jgi:cytochrome c oxidase cbb3-type subunit III
MRIICALVLIAAPVCLAQQAEQRLALIEQGLLVYETNCATCHDKDGGGIEGIDFAKGTYKRVKSDEDFIRLVNSGIPGTGMPPFDIQRGQMRALVAYVRSMSERAAAAAMPGDAGRGKAIFEGKGGCLGCHRVNDKGSRMGPSLTAIGRMRPVGALEQSVLDPGAVVLPTGWSFKAVTREGATITGRRLNEDRNTVQILDAQGRLVSLNKADLLEHAVIRTSTMPSYKDKLTAAEIGDVVKYLTTLKGYDAAPEKADSAQH